MPKNISLFLIVFFSVCFQQRSEAQEIVSVEFEQTTSRFTVLGAMLSIGLFLEAEQDVDVYKVLYTTVGSDMQPDTASGLFLLPADKSKPLPILCYQHGTTDRANVPSELEGGDALLALVFATNGIATVVPDFLGLGNSRGFHPYVHAETQATAAVDLIRALKTFLTSEEIPFTDELLITGYSQGGHAAMALHEYIQTEIPEEMTVTASLPMSGPYDLSGVMLDLALEDKEFFFPSYLVYSTRGLKEIYPNLYENEAQLYKEPYLEDIEQFVNTGENITALNANLVRILIEEEGSTRPGRMFRDSVIQELKSNPDSEFIQSLAESDVYDWTPTAPVLMLYCESDEQVPFRNSIIADSVMNVRGAMSVSAEDVSSGQDLSHGQCVVPALTRGVPWLLSFLEEPTSTEEVDLAAGLSVYPTLTSGMINISAELEIKRLEVFHLTTGQRVYSNDDNTNFVQLDISSSPDGLYVIHLLTDAGYSSKKVMLTK